MAIFVWFMVGVAVWHFAVFVPDRFWGGIVGALLGAAAGALLAGAISQVIIGESVGHTDLATILYAAPGAVIGMAAIYVIGVRAEEA